MASEFVELILRAKDMASEAINGVRGNLDRLKTAGDKIRDVSQNMTDFGMRVGLMGAALTAMTGIPVKFAADFEQAMAKVKSLSGATAEEFTQLTKTAQDLGRTTKFTAEQAADGMGFLAMAGFNATQIIGAMPSVLQLAAAANLDLATSADITSNILTGYGLKVEELGKANDVLVKAFTSSNVNLQQLGQAMKYVGPVASAAGVSFEEAAAAIGLLGNAGIQGSMAGTSLRRIISSLINPTGDAAKELKNLGITVTDASGEFIGLAPIMAQFEKGFKTIGSETEKTAIIMSIFGDRAGPAMASLLEQGSVAVDAFTTKLKNSGGIADKVSTEQMETLKGAFLKVKSAIEGFLISVGTPFLNFLQGAFERFAKFVTWVTELNEKLGPLSTILFSIVGIAGGLLLAVGALATTIGGLGFVVSGVISGLRAWATIIPIVTAALRAMSLTNILSFLSSLTTSITASTVATTALGVALKATLIGAAIWAAMEIGKFIVNLVNYRKELAELKALQADMADEQEYLNQRSEKYNKILQDLGFSTMKEFNQAVRDGKVAFDEQTQSWKLATKATEDHKKTYEDMIFAVTEGSKEYIAIKEQELKTLKANIDYETALLEQRYKDDKITLEAYLSEKQAIQERYTQEIIRLKEMEIESLKEDPEKNLEKIRAAEEEIKQIRIQSTSDQLKAQKELTDGTKKEYDEDMKNWKTLQEAKLQSLESQLDLQNTIEETAVKNGLLRQSELLENQLDRLRQFYELKIQYATENMEKIAAMHGTETEEYKKAVSEREKLQMDLEARIIQSEENIKDQVVKELDEAQRFISKYVDNRLERAEIAHKQEMDQLDKYHQQGLISTEQYEEAKRDIIEKYNEEIRKINATTNNSFMSGLIQIYKQYKQLFGDLEESISGFAESDSWDDVKSNFRDMNTVLTMDWQKMHDSIADYTQQSWDHLFRVLTVGITASFDKLYLYGKDVTEMSGNQVREWANRVKDYVYYVQELFASLQDQIRSWQDELDRLKGNEVAILERWYQEELRKLKEKYGEQFASSKEYHDAELLLKEIYNEKMKALEEKEAIDSATAHDSILSRAAATAKKLTSGVADSIKNMASVMNDYGFDPQGASVDVRKEVVFDASFEMRTFDPETTDRYIRDVFWPRFEKYLQLKGIKI